METRQFQAQLFFRKEHLRVNNKSNFLYILASFQKDDKYIFNKDKNLCCVGNFKPLDTYLSLFFRNKSDDYLYLYIRNQKFVFKTVFLVHNIHLYLYWQVENTKWILCCQKMELNVQYLRFLMYKVLFRFRTFTSIKF